MILAVRALGVAASAVTAAEKRAAAREMMLDRVLDALARMDEPHIEFVGKDGDQVTYPKAPAAAFGTYASSVATLIKTYRLEMGESTSKPEQHVNVSERVEALALEAGLDPEQVRAEAQRIFNEARARQAEE